MRNSIISVTEDFSKKTREARQELRKFLRMVKKTNPERRCFLQYDKLYVEGKLFLYNDLTGQVEEQWGSKLFLYNDLTGQVEEQWGTLTSTEDQNSLRSLSSQRYQESGHLSKHSLLSSSMSSLQDNSKVGVAFTFRTL